MLPGDSVSVPLLAGNYRILISNLAPATTYAITVDLESLAVAPLDLSVPAAAGGGAPLTELKIDEEACPNVKPTLKRLAETADEDDVPAAIAALEAAIVSPCDDSLVVREADRRIEATRRELGPFTVRQGQVLAVRVARMVEPARKWTRTYSSGSRGTWRQTYGFNFIWNEFAPNHHYFVEEGDAQGSYVIRSSRSEDYFELAPSLFYTWMPANKELDDLVVSPTVGLGFDFQAPVLSAGGALTYNQNATLSVGFSFHRVRRLNERYTVGEVVNSLLGEQELQRGVYRVNPYIAVTIRSLTNPFERSTGGSQ